MKISDIMKQLEHMETNTLEQIQEKHNEVMRLIRINHEEEMIKIRLEIQEIRSRTPKMQIYFGKVKTE